MSKHSEVIERTIQEAYFTILTEKTIRETAKEFNVSKSTVCNDFKKFLPLINREGLEAQVKEILKRHKELSHIRGGEATKLKYSKNKK
jgi:putative DeoR family transcriptional regulator (stage III sporulation protein D)